MGVRSCAVTKRLLDEPDVAYDPDDPVGLEGGGVIRPPERAVERDVPLDDARTEHGRGNRGRDTRFVSRISDRYPVALAEGRDHPEVQLGYCDG